MSITADYASIRILSMEDDPGLARLLQKQLHRKGYTVDLASDGEQGLSMLKAGSYHLILVDYTMPVCGGLEVLRILTSDDNAPPTIMLTATGDERIAVEAMKLGAADYMVKDPSMEYLELLPIIIEQVLSNQRLIRERQQMVEALKESEERYRKLVELSPDGIAIHSEGSFAFINPAGLKLLGGSTQEDLLGKPIINVVHPDYHQIVKERINSITKEKGHSSTSWLEEKFIRLDGTEIDVEVSGVKFIYRGTQAIQFIFRDISKRKQMEHRLQYLALYDSLTGLANRTLFFDRLTQILVQAKRYNNIFALLFLDLDRFKLINDTLGHNVGDLLLKEVAAKLTNSVRCSDSVARIVEQSLPESKHIYKAEDKGKLGEKCLRESDSIARMGGDEFTVILTKINQPSDAGIVAQRVINSLAMAFNLDGHECKVSVSIGISFYPLDGDDIGILLKKADMAMYRAKEEGKNTYRFYSENQLVI